MPDPFSVAASVVSVTVPALHGARLLLNDLSSITDAPRTVRSLEEDITSTLLTRDALEKVEDRDWRLLGQTVADQAEMSIQLCDKACVAFRTDLQRWTRHSGGNTLSLRDKTLVGFFKDRQLKAMSGQLQSCKITLNSAISIATLYSSIRHTRITEEMRRNTELSILSAITSTNRQLTDTESNLDELSQDSIGQGDKDTAGTLKQLQEERAALEYTRQLLEELRLKASAEAVAEATQKLQNQTTNITFGRNNTGFQTGIINGGVSGISFGGR